MVNNPQQNLKHLTAEKPANPGIFYQEALPTVPFYVKTSKRPFFIPAKVTIAPAKKPEPSSNTSNADEPSLKPLSRLQKFFYTSLGLLALTGFFVSGFLLAFFVLSKQKTANPIKTSVTRILHKAESTKISPPKADPKLYSIRLGFFASRTNAEELQACLEAENIHSSIAEVPCKDEQTFFVVAMDSYTSYTEAEMIAKNLSKQKGLAYDIHKKKTQDK